MARKGQKFKSAQDWKDEKEKGTFGAAGDCVSLITGEVLQQNKLPAQPRKSPQPKKISSTSPVRIWTDGGCWPNPGGPGAYAAIITYRHHRREVTGFEDSTTNNRMELMGAIAGLRKLTRPTVVEVISDSQYLVKTMTEGWARRVNQDLWDQIDALTRIHKVSWHWVRGHAGNEINERADQLCTQELMKHGFRKEGQLVKAKKKAAKAVKALAATALPDASEEAVQPRL